MNNNISITKQRIIHIIIHIVCLSVYLIPILQLSYNENNILYGGPTLDELHIMSLENNDIHDLTTTSWKQLFLNDYWGRPMISESSHKSWRPLTVLSFRYLKGLYTSNELLIHRIINVITHTVTSDLVGILAIQLIVPYYYYYFFLKKNTTTIRNNNLSFYIHIVTKIIFTLHPTHVEVTANAANRNHILAVLCSTILCCSQTPFILFIIILIAGFLCSETFLFQLPAIIITIIGIQNASNLLLLKINNTNTNINSNNTTNINNTIIISPPSTTTNKENEKENENEKTQQQQQQQTDNTTKTSMNVDTDNNNNDTTTTTDDKNPTTSNATSTTSTTDENKTTTNTTTGNDKNSNSNKNNNNKNMNNMNNNTFYNAIHQLIISMIQQLPRIILIIIGGIIYLSGRYYFDTLNIPEGLIRPAENPFYTFTGEHRIRNYIHVITIHVWKSFGLDPIGYSHEYGYNCIPEISSWDDFISITISKSNIYSPTFILPISPILGLLLLLLLSIVLIILYPTICLSLVAVHWSWFITLFPITGFVKVGTFVSDRLVVASTVPVCIWLGTILVWYSTNILFPTTTTTTTTTITKTPTTTTIKEEDNTTTIKKKKKKKGTTKGSSSSSSSLISVIISTTKPLQIIIIGWIFIMSYNKIHIRTHQWLDSVSLLQSSIQTCPNFAKAHMELSKIYSGLYPTLLDLNKALKHLDIAYSIDPDLCDIHQQYAHVYIQQGEFLLYEEELTQAVLCPFTLGGAFEMWKRYWQIALQSTNSNNNPSGNSNSDIQQRYEKYMRIIQQAALESEMNDKK